MKSANRPNWSLVLGLRTWTKIEGQSPNTKDLTLQFALCTFQISIYSFGKPIESNAQSIGQCRLPIYLGPGGFLRDLDTDARANARGARFDHRARVGHALNAARGLDPEFRSDHAPHQGNVGDRGAAFRKSC